MADDDSTMSDELTRLDVAADLFVRDAAKREIEARLLPWDTIVDALEGREVFRRGAFRDTNPADVVLMLEHTGPPAGVGKRIEERDDGPWMTFGVSRTQRGDEILALAADRVTRFVSVGFTSVDGGTQTAMVAGRRTNVHTRVRLREVSTTWRPAYLEAEIMAVREEGAPDVADPTPTPEAPEAPEPQPAPAPDLRIVEAFDTYAKRSAEATDKILDRLEKLEERNRQDIIIPVAAPAEVQTPASGTWLQAALRILTGERMPDVQKRELADLITTDNVGVVPPTYSSELIGVIDPRRPFMNTTRRLATPDTGMSLIMPKLVTRPTVDIQDNEKDELQSTITSISTETFDAVTKGGAGDISLQLLKRSSPSFLTLYLELLAEAYAQDSEHEAVEAMVDLVGDYGGVNNGGTLDPENLTLGSAWVEGFGAMRRAPDTIWLSSSAVAAFIDAKADGTNAPLYSQLQANFTAGGGVGGSISGLRAVHVPALDDQAVDVLVGPSAGFAWAEDGTFTLQVDVPAKAGRDVALVGILWFAPLYPSAFTAYTIAS
jgi:HK97 family phage prohead protease